MRSLASLLPVLGSLLAASRAAPTCLSEIPCDTPLDTRSLTKRATWLPAQGGCWSDNTNHVRALQYNAGGHHDLTPAKCQSLCEAQGFNLAGVEFGRECFCGNTVFDNNRPTSASRCNMPCAGDSSQTCGGPDSIYIYVKDSYPFTVGPASPVPSYNNYDLTQCWQDNNRILKNSPASTIPADQMTVQKCIDGCAAAGFSSAGLEYGKECYCGNISFPPSQSTPPGECNMPCLGDASQFCGGPNRILIYNNPNANPGNPPPSNGPWTPAQGGCWSDNVDHVRALEHNAGSHHDLTPATCQALCDASGFNLAGVEYGRECYCGNTIMGNNRPSSGICNMACAGDATQNCGGPDAINIYVKDNYPYTTGPASVLDSYNGYSKTQCWQDSSSNRLLKNQPATPISADQLTVQKCIDGCKAAGYSSAGVEYGRECYCDNVSYPPGQSSSMSECDRPCTGDGSQICGGPNRILIYYQPPVTTYRGILQVLNAGNGAVLGYISKHLANGGVQYQLGNEANAVHVTFQGTTGLTSFTGIEVTAEDSDLTTYPIMGLVQGRDNTDSNLRAGSYQYGYVAGTNTNPAATPQVVGNSYPYASTPRTSESKVWNIDVATGTTTFTWTNPDGNPAVIATWIQSNALYFGGDQAAFFARYPAPVTPYTLKWLPRP